MSLFEWSSLCLLWSGGWCGLFSSLDFFDWSGSSFELFGCFFLCLFLFLFFLNVRDVKDSFLCLCRVFCLGFCLICCRFDIFVSGLDDDFGLFLVLLLILACRLFFWEGSDIVLEVIFFFKFLEMVFSDNVLEIFFFFLVWGFGIEIVFFIWIFGEDLLKLFNWFFISFL